MTRGAVTVRGGEVGCADQSPRTEAGGWPPEAPSETLPCQRALTGTHNHVAGGRVETPHLSNEWEVLHGGRQKANPAELLRLAGCQLSGGEA